MRTSAGRRRTPSAPRCALTMWPDPTAPRRVQCGRYVMVNIDGFSSCYTIVKPEKINIRARAPRLIARGPLDRTRGTDCLMFNLSRYFSVTSALVLVVATVGVITLYRNLAVEEIVRLR